MSQAWISMLRWWTWSLPVKATWWKAPRTASELAEGHDVVPLGDRFAVLEPLVEGDAEVAVRGAVGRADLGLFAEVAYQKRESHLSNLLVRRAKPARCGERKARRRRSGGGRPISFQVFVDLHPG
jgi:hypothetical protein